MKKLMLSFSTVFLVLILASCSAQPTKLSFEKAEYTLEIGQSVTLSPKFQFENSANQETENLSVSYASENVNVASVTREGLVTATGVGTTEIRAAVNDIATSVQIIVQ